MTVSRSFLINENQSRPSTALRRQILNPAMWLLCFVPCMIPTQAFGQASAGYVVEVIPIDNTNKNVEVLVNGANNLGMVIGRDSSGTGFVYDHFGYIGNARTVHLITEWILVPGSYPVSSCVGINDAGQIVGYFQNELQQRIGFYLDLDWWGVIPQPSWDYLPAPPDSVSYYGQRINDNGLVFIQSSKQTSDGERYGYGYLFDTTAVAPTLTRIVDPAGVPFQAFCTGINNSGQVCGSFDGASETAGFRLTPGIRLETLPCSAVGINNFGVVAGSTVVQSTRKLTTRVACRYDNALDRLATVESNAIDINESGDIVGYISGPDGIKAALYHESSLGWQPLADIVVSGTATDLAHWSNSTAHRNIYCIANRGGTGFGQIVATATVSSTSGKGRNTVTIKDRRVYMLTPYLL